MSGTATSQFVLIHFPINITNNSLKAVSSVKDILQGTLGTWTSLEGLSYVCLGFKNNSV